MDEPSVPLIDALMTDERTSVIVATGGVPVVRAAYSSGNPAIGVGPGNVPVLVDATADLAAAARRIVDSKSFDNSILCTNESVLIVEEQAAVPLLRQLKRSGAFLLEPEQRDKISALLFPGGRFDIRFVGRDASSITAEAGIRVPASTRVLLAPFDLVVPEEPLAHEKLCPVLGLVRVPWARRGSTPPARCCGCPAGATRPPSTVTDPRVIMEYGAAVEVLRVAVNVGNSLGSAGLRDQPGPVDDDRHRLLRPVFCGREPAPEPPGRVDPAGLQQRPGRAVRRLHRADALAGAGRVQRARAALPGGVQPAGCRAADRRAGPAGEHLGPFGRKWLPAGGRGAARRNPAADHRRALPAGQGVTAPVAELRSFIFLSRLQPQTMCYLGTWIRGSLPRSHVAAQVIEVAPGLDIEPLTDVAVKHADVRAGILVVERQFGYLEIHGGTDEVQAAASAVLGELGATARDAKRPEILAAKIITRLDPQQAFLVNRNKMGSMALAGESLFVLEMRPASYAILAANEAEKAARVKLVDYRMIGATGRLYLSGSEADVRQAADAAEDALRSLAGGTA